MGKITKDGIFLEQLETNPAKYLPEVEQDLSNHVVKVSFTSIYIDFSYLPPAHFVCLNIWPLLDCFPLLSNSFQIDLNKGMDALRAELSKYPIKTRLSLSGTIIVARDIAHAKMKEKLDAGEPLPDYFKNHIIYYAGPAKTPEGMPSGSFGTLHGLSSFA